MTTIPDSLPFRIRFAWCKTFRLFSPSFTPSPNARAPDEVIATEALLKKISSARSQPPSSACGRKRAVGWVRALFCIIFRPGWGGAGSILKTYSLCQKNEAGAMAARSLSAPGRDRQRDRVRPHGMGGARLERTRHPVLSKLGARPNESGLSIAYPRRHRPTRAGKRRQIADRRWLSTSFQNPSCFSRAMK